MRRFLFLAIIFLLVPSFCFSGDLIGQQKADYLESLRSISQQIIDLRYAADKIQALYFSRTYQSGGDKEIVLSDLTGTIYEGLTISQVTAIITTLQAFETFMAAGNADNLSKITK